MAVREGRLYWASPSGNQLWESAVDGEGAKWIHTPLDDVKSPFDIDVDAAFVYWTELAGNGVWRKPRAGGPKENLGSGTGQTAYLAVASGHLAVTDYWVNEPSKGGIILFDLGGGTGGYLFPSEPRAAGIAIDGGLLIWGRTSPDGIQSGSVEGGASASLVSAEGAAVGGLGIDAGYIYWIADDSRIVRTRRADGSSLTLHQGAAFGGGDVAVDESAVYWSERAAGIIRRLALSGLPP